MLVNPRNRSLLWAVTLVSGWGLLADPAQAEVIEEVVAWVNGDIVTRSELEQQEQVMISDAYRQYTGEDLDKAVDQVRKTILVQLIDNKILTGRARNLYDLERMGSQLLRTFMRQNGYEDEEAFLQQVQSEGFTRETFIERLIGIYAPSQVIDFEVTGRISVSDRAVDEYYDEHPDEFRIPGAVTFREIVLLADDDAKKQQRLPEARAAIERAQAEGFDTVATELSEAGTRRKGGLIENRERGDLSELIANHVFEAEPGSISEPLEAPYGWHILLVESRTEDRLEAAETAKEKVREKLLNQRYQDELARFLQKARDEAEWCVKKAYRDRIPFETPACKML